MPPNPSPARLALHATSVGGLLALAWAGTGLAELSVLATGLAAHATLSTLGVLAPGLSVFGQVLGRGKPGLRRVALTFDDGPDPDTTPRVLSALAEHGARATFFALGEKVARHPKLVRDVVGAGHELGLHGHVHDRLYALRSVAHLRADIARGLHALEAASGSRPRLFRPPVGFVSHTVALAAEAEGLSLVGFTRRARDGRSRAEPAKVLARALAGLEDGAVLLLHDAAERGGHRPASLDVLGALLSAVADARLETVTVSELFDLAPVPANASHPAARAEAGPAAARGS